MTAKLEEGKQLGECMEDAPFMPRPLVEMAVVGEETGALEETLATMGAFCLLYTSKPSPRCWWAF